jgi:hypothetical protein
MISHRRLATLVVTLLWLLAGVAVAQPSAGAQEPMTCQTGPLPKTYGGSAWLVYSCADGRSVVVVSAPGNAATPFYFMFHAAPGGYSLVAEGNAPKAVTRKAYAELSALSQQEIIRLVEQTRAARK